MRLRKWSLVLQSSRSFVMFAFDEDNRLKRKRRDGCSSPANIDVSGLIGANSAVNDPSRQNRFSILADLEIENVGHVDNVKRSNNKEANGECNKSLGSAGKMFCPPIFLYDVNIKGLSEQLEAKTPKIHFKIKNVNKHKSKLYISDVSVHAEMMSIPNFQIHHLIFQEK